MWIHLLVHVVQGQFVCMCKSEDSLHETMMATSWERMTQRECMRHKRMATHRRIHIYFDFTVKAIIQWKGENRENRQFIGEERENRP